MRKVLVEKTVLAPAAVVGVEDKQTQLGARHGEWLRRQRPGSRSSETLKRNSKQCRQLLDSCSEDKSGEGETEEWGREGEEGG